MKRLWMILFCLMTTAALAASDADLQQRFFKASEAYNAQQYAVSVELLEQLVTDGYGNAEVYYNLGNAYFKSGKTGYAIANYHRALFFDPSDPDVNANMTLAMQQTGAMKEDTSAVLEAFQKVSYTAWRNISILSLWVLAAFTAGYLLLAFKRFTLAGLIMAVIVAALSFTGIGLWQNRLSSGEAVIVQKEMMVRYAPLSEGKVFYTVTEGTVVQVVEQKEGWAKVTFDNRKGWVPEKAIELIWKMSGR